MKRSGGHTVRLESVKDAVGYWRDKNHFRGKGTRLKLAIAQDARCPKLLDASHTPGFHHVLWTDLNPKLLKI